MYGKWSCILPITWTHGEKTEVSYTCYNSSTEVELKNEAKKYRPEELQNQEKQVTAKSKFRDGNLMAQQNSSTLVHRCMAATILI